MDTGGKKKVFMAVTCVICWVALIVQLYLILQTRSQTGFSTLKTVTNFFSYFTIISNLFVGMCLGSILVFPETRTARFFSNNSVQAAIALYILIVAFVYNSVLRGQVALAGTGAIVNEMLHVVVPVLYVIWWFLYSNAGIRWKHLSYWLVLPALYLTWSLLRGPVAGWYPYPFLNVNSLGLSQVLINAGLVLLAFLVTGSGVLALKRHKS
jgi:hypothetical protein